VTVTKESGKVKYGDGEDILGDFIEYIKEIFIIK
jgi:hypothetical protein